MVLGLANHMHAPLVLVDSWHLLGGLRIIRCDRKGHHGHYGQQNQATLHDEAVGTGPSVAGDVGLMTQCNNKCTLSLEM
jgi:hypothetical protein